MFLRRLHMRDGECGERLGLVGNLFNFQTNAEKPCRDLINVGCGVEIVLEPGEGEFHDNPPARFGIWSALKP